MAELLTVIGTLGIVLVRIAVLLQIISIEEILAFLGRALAIFVLVLVVLCILKRFWLGVMIPWLSAAFGSFKALIEWLLLIIVGLIALSLIAQLALWQLGRYLTLRRDPQTGDGYDRNDSKGAKN
jgi:hypothetical protein